MVWVFSAFLAVSLLAVVILLAREAGKTQALLDESEDDLQEAAKLMKEGEDVQKIRRKAVDDTRTGRVQSKHYID